MSGHAVVWSEDDGPPRPGQLVVGDAGFELHGGRRDAALTVAAAAIADMYVERDATRRVRGGPTLVVERGGAPPLRIGALGFGVLGEVLELVGALADGMPHERAIVVVPLRPDRVARARELIGAGPPFDPAAVGLRRHDVFVTEREAIFVLDGPAIEATLRRLLRDASTWRGAAAWRSCVAGRPQLADHAYGWGAASAAA